MTQTILLCLLTFVASGLGTATGFGTSTLMVPVLAFFVPVPVTLLFVGLIHLCGDIWKVLLFRSGFDGKLVLGFGLSGIVASFAGASLSVKTPGLPLKQVLGGFLLLYTIYLFRKPQWALPKTNGTAVCGGLLSGLFAGFFGVGGAVRGAFLTAFDLPKKEYVFTAGLIAFFIDITRVTSYFAGGILLQANLLYTLFACIPLSFIGALTAKKFLDRLPQKKFRFFVGVFLGLAGLKLLIWPG
ncbi:MAG TPA: sulfite exporter TauE/SafE family protein [Desulfobacteraceae bacterium]|nr:sulfite exporter TauE/SafE family protein [Desulfobacteraceae bacterium]